MGAIERKSAVSLLPCSEQPIRIARSTGTLVKSRRTGRLGSPGRAERAVTAEGFVIFMFDTYDQTDKVREIWNF